MECPPWTRDLQGASYTLNLIEMAPNSADSILLELQGKSEVSTDEKRRKQLIPEISRNQESPFPSPELSDCSPGPQGRLMSLDFFRGFTMFLLIGEGTHIYDLLIAPELSGTFVSTIGTQFHHHPWNGLRFWDLIQPFFMFIVGVAMPFSIGKRWEHGDTWGATFRHALQRSFLLLLFGWALYCIGPGKLTFELWNVLAQLSFTYLVAFLMMRKSSATQIAFTFGLL